MESIKRAEKELEKLLKGNRNFVNGTPTTKNMTLETLQKYAFHQEPYACVLTCSDSRVVPEIIFDCGIGELFVARVAGMTTGPNVVESIEYAVKKLNVPLLILLGHDDCGVMKYAKECYPEPMSNFSSILKCVYPVLDKKEDNGSAATDQNVTNPTNLGAEGEKALDDNLESSMNIYAEGEKAPDDNLESPMNIYTEGEKHNFFAQEHTKWVEDYLMKHSVIINEAVKNDKLLIAKCHFNHGTGLVELI